MLLSIVTVVKNDLTGLQRTLASFSYLPEGRVEVLVVDGGSTDGSEILARSSNRRMIESRPDGGIYPAMWRGAELAIGKYLMFINSGEKLLDYSLLERALRVLEGSQWGFGPVIEKSLRGTYVWTSTGEAPSLKKIAYRKTFVPFPATIFNRKFFLTLGGFDSRYLIAADYDIEVRATKLAKPLVWDFPLVLFQSGGISYTHPVRAWREEHLSRCVNLNYSGILRMLSFYALSRRTLRFYAGKVLDFLDSNLLRGKSNWRDRNAEKIPSEFLKFLL